MAWSSLEARPGWQAEIARFASKSQDSRENTENFARELERRHGAAQAVDLADPGPHRLVSQLPCRGEEAPETAMAALEQAFDAAGSDLLCRVLLAPVRVREPITLRAHGRGEPRPRSTESAGRWTPKNAARRWR